MSDVQGGIDGATGFSCSKVAFKPSMLRFSKRAKGEPVSYSVPIREYEKRILSHLQKSVRTMVSMAERKIGILHEKGGDGAKAFENITQQSPL